MPLELVFLPGPFGQRLTMDLGFGIDIYFECRRLHYESGWNGNPLPIVAAANGGVSDLTVSLSDVNASTRGGIAGVVEPFWSAIRSCRNTLVKLRLNLSFRRHPELKSRAVDSLANEFSHLEFLALDHNLYGLTMTDVIQILSSPTCKLKTLDNCQCSAAESLVVQLLPDHLPSLEEICAPLSASMGPMFLVGPLPLRQLMAKAPNLKRICFNYTHVQLTETTFQLFMREFNRIIEVSDYGVNIMVVSYSHSNQRMNFFRMIFEHEYPAVVRFRTIWTHRSSVLNCDIERNDGVRFYLSIVGCLSFCAVTNNFSSYRRALPPVHHLP
ncbi:MAG: hypothetical protein GY740_07225 [Gammaproteobacteria bacterium]|nr:hypothetical protein [Gammaproteobacteria bacterium]